MEKTSGRFRPSWYGVRKGKNEVHSQTGLIPIHWLHTHAYCEYQLYLEKVRGIEALPSMEMLAGAEKHAALDQEHIEKAEMELTVSEASAKAKLEAIALIARDVPVKGTTLYGRIDEAVLEPERIIILDDKPGAFPYFSNKLQVWGYCLAYRETYQPDLPLFGALRREDSGEVIWLEQFTEDHAGLVTITVSRIQEVLSGIENPRPANNSNKCRPCRFKDYCPSFTGK